MIRISRRHFLRLVGGSAIGAAVGVPFLSGMSGANSTGTLLRSQRPLPQPFARPLFVPPVLTPTRSDDSGDYYELAQRAALAEILPGVQTPIWGYNGIFPGPTIVSRRGAQTIVRHRNELPVPVVVHLHGGRTAPEHDGYPTDLLWPVGADHATVGHRHGGTIADGEREYRYPLAQRAATLWYHDHRMDFTGASVWRGLAGFHLVSDAEEESLPLPRGERDLPLMITDRAFDADGSFLYPSRDPLMRDQPGVVSPYGAGVLGDVILVNGVPWPVAAVPAARHRLRILNASNARRYRLALDLPPPGGGGLVQIGADGGLLDRPRAHEAVEIAPAQRFDVVVDFGRYTIGQEITLVNKFDNNLTGMIMRFRVDRIVSDETQIPAQLSATPAADPATALTTRTIRFRNSETDGMAGWTINDEPFAPDRIHARVRRGSMEIWRIVSDFHHPFHLHSARFRILSRGIGGPGPYDHGWRDTLDLRPAEEAAILIDFDTYAGKYVFHCHNLEHEDMGMMGNVLVE